MSRGYGRNDGLFKGLPENMEWERVRMNIGDLSAACYINHDPYWESLSGGTRQVTNAVKRLHAGEAQNERLFALAKKIEVGEKFPEIILVGRRGKKKLVILEGHARLTAYLLAHKSAPHLPRALEVIIGYSPDIQHWVFF